MTLNPTIKIPAGHKVAALASSRTLLRHVLASAKRHLTNQLDDPAAAPLAARLDDPATLKKMVLIAHHDSVREKISEIYLAAIKRCLVTVHADTLHQLGKTGASVKLVKPVKNTTPAMMDFPFDLANFSRMFSGEMRTAGAAALQQSGESRAAELGLDPDEFETDHGIAKKFLIERENKLKDVPQDIYDRVKAALEAGTNAGETEKQLAGRVATELGDYETGNAQTIARTETASAYGTASQDAIEQAGFKFKSWLTADDGRVRTSHQMCEDQGPIPLEDSFSNGLDFPGDPEGEADEVINCRCVLQAEEDGGAE